MGQLAAQAGYALDLRRIVADKNARNAAAERAFNGDTKGIEQIFSSAVRPSMSVAFETLPREDAAARHPELRATFATLDGKATELQRRYPNNEKAQSHFLAQAKAEIIRSLDTGKQLIAQPLPEGLAQTKSPTPSTATRK